MSIIEINTCCANFSLTVVSSHLVLSMTFSSSFLVETKLDSFEKKKELQQKIFLIKEKKIKTNHSCIPQYYMQSPKRCFLTREVLKLSNFSYKWNNLDLISQKLVYAFGNTASLNKMTDILRFFVETKLKSFI